MENPAELLADNPEQDAASAGLTYVHDEEETRSYQRRRSGEGFTYHTTDGQLLSKGTDERSRVEALVIPPAWKSVWIAADPSAHLQATGTDDAGRKQYMYHEEWTRARAEQKFRRLVALGQVLPGIRSQVSDDLRSDVLSRNRVLGAVIRLLDSTHARIGSQQYADANKTYGLATLRKKHVSGIDDGRAVLEFIGKSSKEWELDVQTPAVVSVISECLDTPGYALFKFFDDNEKKIPVDASAVNEHLSELSGVPVTAKDFRTWAGTVFAAAALKEAELELPDASAEKRIVHAVDTVSSRLGNTPTVCRECYIDPAVLEEFPTDKLQASDVELPGLRAARAEGKLSRVEKLVWEFLRNRL